MSERRFGIGAITTGSSRSVTRIGIASCIKIPAANRLIDRGFTLAASTPHGNGSKPTGDFTHLQETPVVNPITPTIYSNGHYDELDLALDRLPPIYQAAQKVKEKV